MGTRGWRENWRDEREGRGKKDRGSRLSDRGAFQAVLGRGVGAAVGMKEVDGRTEIISLSAVALRVSRYDLRQFIGV